MATLELKPIPTGEQAAPVSPVTALVATAIEKKMAIDKLTALYLKLRASKQDLEKQAKQKLEPINSALEALEGHFLTTMNDMGVDSLKNEAGTPYKVEKVSVTLADKPMFLEYVLTRAAAALPVTDAARQAMVRVIIESGELDLIDARAGKTALEALLQETKELAPGVNRRVEQSVNVRAS